LLTSAALGVVLTTLVLVPPARAQDAQKPVPTVANQGKETSETVATTTGGVVYLRGDFFNDFAVGTLGGGVTLHDDGRSNISLWVDAYEGEAREFGVPDFQAGSVGLQYRHSLGKTDSWGTHLFFDFGSEQSFSDTLAQVSLGGDVVHALKGAGDQTLRIGGNLYVPLDDYTNVASYGVLDTAPLLGGDGFARYGRDIAKGALRLDVTVGAFDYGARHDSENIWGGYGSIGFSTTRGLPHGLTSSVEAGLRYANGGGGPFNQNDRTTPFLGLQLSYSWGGSRTTTERTVTQNTVRPSRDCAVSREGDAQPEYDCSVHVQSGDAVSEARTKGGTTREVLPPPDPTIETRRLVKQGVMPMAPVRNIGFASPFTPIKRAAGFTTTPPASS
jgi:hypothetical protein